MHVDRPVYLVGRAPRTSFIDSTMRAFYWARPLHEPDTGRNAPTVSLTTRALETRALSLSVGVGGAGG